MARLLQRIDARGHGQRELLFEPGRSLVGNAGVLLTEVLYCKPGEQKNFCIVDAAMNDLMRPAMYEACMGIVPCTLRDGAAASCGTSSARSANRATGSAATARWRCSPATIWPCCRPAPMP